MIDLKDIDITDIRFNMTPETPVQISDVYWGNIHIWPEGPLPTYKSIRYTSTDSQVVTPYNTTGFGANIVSNIYYPNEAYGEIKFNNDITYIAYQGFYSRNKLSSIIIPSGVSILDEAFLGCTSLSSIFISEGVTDIGSTVFKNCSSLTSITIPNTVEGIGQWAFEGCTALKDVTLPVNNNFIQLSYEIFRGCTALSSITIPNCVNYIVDRAFLLCTALSSITMPTSVVWFFQYAFSGCENLSTINYGGTKSQWNNITKDNRWNYGCPEITVHCTNGDIIISPG